MRATIAMTQTSKESILLRAQTSLHICENRQSLNSSHTLGKNKYKGTYYSSIRDCIFENSIYVLRKVGIDTILEWLCAK